MFTELADAFLTVCTIDNRRLLTEILVPGLFRLRASSIETFNTEG